MGLVYPRGAQRAQLRSDNGKVFTSKHFQTCCKQYGLSQEIIPPYTPQQNGMIERFFRSLKEECIWQNHFKTFEQAKTAIGAWVRFYNGERPHQALNYRSRRSAAPSNNYTKRLDTRGALQNQTTRHDQQQKTPAITISNGQYFCFVYDQFGMNVFASVHVLGSEVVSGPCFTAKGEQIMGQYTIIGKRDDRNGALITVKLSGNVEQTKAAVITFINNGHIYKTSGGATVRVVKGSSGNYLRTDANNTEKDNLENVPNY